MGQTKHGRSALGLVALLMASLLAWPAIGLAQLGGLLPSPGTSTTTVTGDASAVSATVLGLLGTATTTALADTGTLSGVNDARDATMDNLLVNATPIAITGAPNQVVGIPGGQIIINEQTISSTGTAVVNALHVTVAGVADVVIASATAGIA